MVDVTLNFVGNGPGGSGGGGPPYQATDLGDFVSTSLASAQTLTQIATIIPLGATFALVSAEVTDVRWRGDGVAVTANGIGQILYAGTAMWISGNLASYSFIQLAATARLNVSFFQ